MYIEVFKYFIRLGLLGFGGPLALIGSMQKDLVEDKRWMEPSDFNATFSLIKAMPGPLAFQTAVTLGRARAGFFGACIAGFALNFPAFCLMVLFSIFFSSLSGFESTKLLMLGMQVSALGVIIGSLKGLIRSHITDFFFWVMIAISGLINFFHPQLEPIVILGFGLLMVMVRKYVTRELGSLILVCFKAGALVFGSGLAIVPMLQHDVVEKYHWLSQSEFLDALAFGQMTPGPVVITATYVGHKVAGMQGALLATLAIFAASFFHMTTWFPLVTEKLRGKAWVKDFTYGAIAAVVGPIIVAVIKLGMGIHMTGALLVLSALSFVITLSGKVPLWLIIPASGVLSLIMHYLL
jgi:chromate transporter